jgi:hypothetical protein
VEAGGNRKRMGDGSTLAIWRSCFVVKVLPGLAFCRLDHFTYRRKSPDKPIVIGLALNVSGGRWLRPLDAIEDPQPYEHKEAADAIERSPPGTTRRFEQRVCDFRRRSRVAVAVQEGILSVR